MHYTITIILKMHRGAESLRRRRRSHLRRYTNSVSIGTQFFARYPPPPSVYLPPTRERDSKTNTVHSLNTVFVRANSSARLENELDDVILRKSCYNIINALPIPCTYLCWVECKHINLTDFCL